MDTIIYARWSSAEQSKGHSRERQLSLCREFAARMDWTVVDEVIEEGQSAFTGIHRRTGKLGDLQRAFEDDRYPNGVVLLVERLDRLSREAPAQFFLWLSAVTAKGVTVATVDGGRTYNGSNLDMAAIIEVVVKASLANDESLSKSRRVGAAWAAKRAKLADGAREVMTRRAPGWLLVDEESQRFVIEPTRAAIVKRIFDETTDGRGKHSIARSLNEESIRTFGRSHAWHASYIQKILSSPSVLGEFQPGVKPRGFQRRLVDTPIKDYYPAVIDADLYARARVAMTLRSRISMGRGASIANIFSGLGRCAICNGKMTLRSKGKKTRADGRVVREDYLVCDNVQRGIIVRDGEKCHNNVRFNYQVIEKGVLDAVLSEAMDDTHFVEGSAAHQLAIQLASAEMDVSRLDRRVRATLELIGEDDHDEEVKQAYREAKQSKKDQLAIVADLHAQLLRARGRVSPEEHAARIAHVRSELDSPDEAVRLRARSSVRLALGELIEEMNFHRKGRRVGIRLLSGSRLLTISADDGGVSLDIIPSSTDTGGTGISDRQQRARDRVLNANNVRRQTASPVPPINKGGRPSRPRTTVRKKNGKAPGDA